MKKREWVEANLLSNRESGDGGIAMSPSFDKQTYLFQIDVIKDWIKLLQIEYAERWDLWATQMESLDPGPMRTDRKKGPERQHAR